MDEKTEKTLLEFAKTIDNGFKIIKSIITIQIISFSLTIIICCAIAYFSKYI